MRRLGCWVLGALALPGLASDVVSFVRLRNAVGVTLDDGRAEVEWITPSTVRVRRDRSKRDGVIATRQRPPVEFSIGDTEPTITARSRELTVEISKKPFEVRFLSGDEPALLTWKGQPSGVAFEVTAEERFFGLGARADPQLNARGKHLRTERPLLLSSRLYGIYFPWSGEYTFDVGRSQAKQVMVTCPDPDRVDFYFYSAGGLKEVLEQHHGVERNDFEFTRVDVKGAATSKPDFAFTLPREWPANLYALLNASLSGMAVPAVLLSGQPEQLAALMPVVISDSDAKLAGEARSLRDSFHTHFLTYVQEAHDRGLPFIHPLALQFPRDAKAATVVDEFMLGDEILVATQNEVYLPPGLWTDLESGRTYRGRQTVRMDGAWRMLAHNGTIVPRDREFGIELHYFPKLGAEYFIPEIESGEVTQIHAGPSVDVLRLEIEERAGRAYEWIIHNVSMPAEIRRGGEPLRRDDWHYDERASRLHIRARAASGEDLILNVSFPKEEWYKLP